jgi:hypothetical protein|tara:strand:+ start:400 stop:840 length:441 start_codon:yes stop_codon:yes gene_type:complete
MRIVGSDLREMKILKYYRLVRKWVCKTYNIKEADLELLIYLESLNRFNRKDFMDGVYLFSWDKHRWERLRREGWIEVWRERNRIDSKYAIYKVSFKFSNIISRIYRIMAGEEDLPVSEKNVFYKNKTYTDKVFNKAINDMIKDKDR